MDTNKIYVDSHIPQDVMYTFVCENVADHAKFVSMMKQQGIDVRAVTAPSKQGYHSDYPIGQYQYVNFCFI